MILEKDRLPAAPIGERIIVRPFPPEEMEAGLVIPDIAKVRANMGIIIHAGLRALDKMYDHGYELGDEVWWGKYAGVIEQWDHIVHEGAKYKQCKAHDWGRRPSPGDRISEWTCDHCGSERRAEPILVMSVDDILTSVSLQLRIESGEVSYVRGKVANGATQHIIDRKDK